MAIATPTRSYPILITRYWRLLFVAMLVLLHLTAMRGVEDVWARALMVAHFGQNRAVQLHRGPNTGRSCLGPGPFGRGWRIDLHVTGRTPAQTGSASPRAVARWCVRMP